MTYRVYEEEKKRLKKAKWTARELAALWDESPSMARARLNGFATMPHDKLRQLQEALDENERQER